MIVVITIRNCPDKIRGDLTKWLFEIDTGVFVGNLNKRVREGLWERICSNIKSGTVTMAFGANNEQKLDFKIHNSDWESVDYDGIKLVRRNFAINNSNSSPKVIQQHINSLSQRKKTSPLDIEKYVVIDIETTGLSDTDKIIEIGAVRVESGIIQDEFSVLLKCEIPLSKEIMELTGLTDKTLIEEGIDIKEALEMFQEFCGEYELIGHNIQQFDMKFLNMSCIENELPIMRNRTKDTMRIARRKLDCKNYTLRTIADYLEIEYSRDKLHRALEDCRIEHKIFEKLKEI